MKRSTESMEDTDEGSCVSIDADVSQNEEGGFGAQAQRPLLVTERSGKKKKGASSDERWEDMFQRLLQYRDRHGDCHVPNRYEEDPKLGAWVSTQRRHYRVAKAQQIESKSLSEERIRRLEEAGFEWTGQNPRHRQWDVRYAELRQFKERFGHASVPIGWSENVQLANWTSTQRQEYKNLLKGNPSRLDERRVNLLNEIGFVWSVQRGGRKRKLTASSGDYSSSEAEDIQEDGEAERKREEGKFNNQVAASAGALRQMGSLAGTREIGARYSTNSPCEDSDGSTVSDSKKQRRTAQRGETRNIETVSRDVREGNHAVPDTIRHFPPISFSSGPSQSLGLAAVHSNERELNEMVRTSLQNGQFTATQQPNLGPLYLASPDPHQALLVGEAERTLFGSNRTHPFHSIGSLSSGGDLNSILADMQRRQQGASNVLLALQQSFGENRADLATAARTDRAQFIFDNLQGHYGTDSLFQRPVGLGSRTTDISADAYFRNRLLASVVASNRLRLDNMHSASTRMQSSQFILPPFSGIPQMELRGESGDEESKVNAAGDRTGR